MQETKRTDYRVSPWVVVGWMFTIFNLATIGAMLSSVAGHLDRIATALERMAAR